jgi:hypothetical protein
MLDAIRDDAVQLYAAGAFTTGEVGGNTAATSTTNKSRRLCDVCGLFDDALSCVNAGNVQQREDLFDLMGDLRELIMNEFGRPLAETMELQYLRYLQEMGDSTGVTWTSITPRITTTILFGA